MYSTFTVFAKLTENTNKNVPKKLFFLEKNPTRIYAQPGVTEKDKKQENSRIKLAPI